MYEAQTYYQQNGAENLKIRKMQPLYKENVQQEKPKQAINRFS